MKFFFKMVLWSFFVVMAGLEAAAAIGCTLSNPARDLKSLYPEMTSYREDVREFSKMSQGRETYDALAARVGSALDPVYESFDTPYTLYSVFKEGERIGYVHGVNVAGRGGVIQIFVSLHPVTAAIEKLVFQRLESPGGRAMRAREVREQFTGLTLADFYKHDYFAVADASNAADRIASIKVPATLPELAKPDWAATMRGIRKNLVLMDVFVYDRRHEPFFERAQQAQAAR